MTEKVSRRQAENKKKLAKAAKQQTNPDKPSGPRFRKSPAGDRLAALRDRKMKDEKGE